MRRRRATVALGLALASLTLAACGGDDEKATKDPAPAVEEPRQQTTPPGGLNGLPPWVR